MEKKTVSFMRSLCMGQIEEEVILPFPTLADSERETLQTVVTSVGQLMGSHEKDFRTWDEKAELPAEFIEARAWLESVGVPHDGPDVCAVLGRLAAGSSVPSP